MFPVVRYLTWKLELVSNILWPVVSLQKVGTNDKTTNQSFKTIDPALETLVNVATTRNQENDAPTIFSTATKVIFTISKSYFQTLRTILLV